ncbi:Nn.00g014910.m01.CDS01 [Neocucurbitaria sp. VM-36]
MKASIIASTVALFSGALAVPTLSARQAPQFFTFSLSNDITGANAARSVVVNGGPVTLGGLFTWSPLVKDGRVIATSAQNLNPVGGAVLCVFTDPATGKVFRLNDKVTFADLDGNDQAAVQTDVTDFTFQCEL